MNNRTVINKGEKEPEMQRGSNNKEQEGRKVKMKRRTGGRRGKA